MIGSVMEAAARVDAVGGAGASFEAMRPRIVGGLIGGVPETPEPPPVAVDDFADAIARAARSRADAIWAMKAYASTVVALARDLAGHDPRHARPADVIAVEIIAKALADVYDAERIELPVAFRQTSAALDVAKGEAVVGALSGGTDEP